MTESIINTMAIRLLFLPLNLKKFNQDINAFIVFTLKLKVIKMILMIFFWPGNETVDTNAASDFKVIDHMYAEKMHVPMLHQKRNKMTKLGNMADKSD